MRTRTKLILAAASGYALRAYTKRDVRQTNDDYRHPSDNKAPQYAPFSAFKSDFMNRQAEKALRKVAEKITSVIFNDLDKSRAHSRPTPYERRYYNRQYYGPDDRTTRYARFGRRN